MVTYAYARGVTSIITLGACSLSFIIVNLLEDTNPGHTSKSAGSGSSRREFLTISVIRGWGIGTNRGHALIRSFSNVDMHRDQTWTMDTKGQALCLSSMVGQVRPPGLSPEEVNERSLNEPQNMV